MSSVRPPISQSFRAFSLLEVMVASAVLAIVMAILLGALSTSLSLWRNTEGKLAADREGRAAELMMAQDLASAVVPADPALWPRVNNGRLQFLTAKSTDYQTTGDNNLGDVCFVEYSVSQDGTALMRNFLGSGETFDQVIGAASPAFPNLPANRAQMLATNLLSNPRDAVRGLFLADNLTTTNHFTVLNRELLPRSSSDPDPPVAVEVNFAVTDPEGIANRDLLNSPGYKLRNAGYYSFRIQLPQPAKTP